MEHWRIGLILATELAVIMAAPACCLEPRATITVTIADEMADLPGANSICGMWASWWVDQESKPKIDNQGVPIPPKEGTHCMRPFEMGELGDEYVFIDSTAPNDWIWYWAFRDLNDNEALDPGEPFGLAPGNPQNVDPDKSNNCKFEFEIRIDHIYQPE